MSVLNSLLNNEGVKKQILNMFVKKYKDAGIKKVILELDENDEIQMTFPAPGQILVDETDYNYLKTFFMQNKNLITCFICALLISCAGAPRQFTKGTIQKVEGNIITVNNKKFMVNTPGKVGDTVTIYRTVNKNLINTVKL